MTITSAGNCLVVRWVEFSNILHGKALEVMPDTPRQLGQALHDGLNPRPQLLVVPRASPPHSPTRSSLQGRSGADAERAKAGTRLRGNPAGSKFRRVPDSEKAETQGVAADVIGRMRRVLLSSRSTIWRWRATIATASGRWGCWCIMRAIRVAVHPPLYS
jgi:hypothetical protein